MESFIINTNIISTNIDKLNNSKKYYGNKKTTFSSSSYGYEQNLSRFLTELREIYEDISTNINNLTEYLKDLKEDVEAVDNKLSGGKGVSKNTVINSEINKHVNTIELCNINEKPLKKANTIKVSNNYKTTTPSKTMQKKTNVIATAGMCALAFGEGVLNVGEMIIDGGAILVSGACSIFDMLAGTNSAESVTNFIETDWTKKGYYNIASSTGLDQYADPDGTAAQICSTAGNIAGIVGISLLTGGIGAAAYGAGSAGAVAFTAATGAGVGFLSNAGSAGEMALQGGATKKEAMTSSLISGGYGAITGGLGGKLDALARGSKGIGQIAKYALANFGLGASEPVVNEVADTVIYQNDGKTGFVNNFFTNANKDGLLFNMALAGGVSSLGTLGNGVAQKLSVKTSSSIDTQLPKLKMSDLVYDKVNLPNNLVSRLKSNLNKFSYTDTNDIPGLNQKIKSEGLYHFTNNPDEILSSGHVKPSNKLRSYGNNKSFFFSGIPDVGAYATNLDKLPLKTTAIKINPSDDVLNSSKLRVRSNDDGAITFDGKFVFDGNNASKEYFVLIKDGDNLSYKNVSKEIYDNFENTTAGKQMNDFINNKKNVSTIKDDFYYKMAIKESGAYATKIGKGNYQSVLDMPQISSKEIRSIEDQIYILKQRYGTKNLSIISFDVESLENITLEDINKIRKNFNDCDILFITPDKKRHSLSDVEYRLKTYDETTAELDVNEIKLQDDMINANARAQEGQSSVISVKKLDQVPTDIIDKNNTKYINFMDDEKIYPYDDVMNRINRGNSIKMKLSESVRHIDDPIAKARKLYIEINKYLHYDMNILFSNEQTKKSILDNIVTFENLNNENNIVCKSWSELFSDLLKSCGFNDSQVEIKSNTGNTHYWVEINLGNGKIISCDATEAINNEIDLATCKAGMPTNGFLLLSDKYTGVRPAMLYKNENTINVIKNSNNIIKDYDIDLEYSNQSGYLIDYIQEAENLFSDTSNIKNSINPVKIFDLEIPENMNGYEVFCYYNYIVKKFNLSNVGIKTYYRKNHGVVEPINVLYYNGEYQIYSKNLGKVFFHNQQDFVSFVKKMNIKDAKGIRDENR